MTTPTITLNSGTSIPQLGLGVWQATNDETEAAVRFALDEAGYRHIDTAAAYGNEEGVGRGIRSSAVPREEIFLTTKLWNSDQGYEPALQAFDASLAKLGTDYVDLYLIHWPLQDTDRIERTWEALEKIAESGRAKAIGVCNFEPHHLQVLLDLGGTVPAVDQVELHPHLTQKEVRAFAADHGVTVESWSPLGGTSNSGWGSASKPNTLLADPIIARIADRHSKTPAQILIRWHLQNGLIVIPKSVHEERIAQNIDVYDFELTDLDLSEIDTLDDGTRVGAHPDELNIGAPE
ncbi:aldo/keto reductase [Rhodococcus triatomae]|uniref:2,5-diketo-D-gluconate reductase A n=1 Tax=Rhodococcus triatomae TaxID=300028 RepID=A0A1G8BDF7_9NOCA|nr:aldo/keto reductase [Rhodococcus triatomae]QNG17454.1 aldo/keto reductase [Rhodococcus triatomae]QNG22878.1 aldo/keto reductase [Rhodococcus triatomae]SDH30630.1 2,5-diketo-D-gluconate reductase A [Rhodococcus triatomae]